MGDHDYDREKDEDGDDGDSRGTSSTLKRVAKMVRREEEENRRFSLKKELERIDRNEKEYVKDTDFVDLLRTIDVSKHDAKDLARTYEGHREGRVEYYKFLDDLAEKTKKSSSRGKSSRRMDRDTKETMRVVRKFARKNERAMRSFY